MYPDAIGAGRSVLTAAPMRGMRHRFARPPIEPGRLVRTPGSSGLEISLTSLLWGSQCRTSQVAARSPCGRPGVFADLVAEGQGGYLCTVFRISIRWAVR